jgi:hypothetical protein
MRCARGVKESADMPGQHASGREGSQECIRGTGPRPLSGDSCVPSTWRAASHGHTQEQHMLTMQPAACAAATRQHGAAGAACAVAPLQRCSRLCGACTARAVT